MFTNISFQETILKVLHDFFVQFLVDVRIPENSSHVIQTRHKQTTFTKDDIW